MKKRFIRKSLIITSDLYAFSLSVNEGIIRVANKCFINEDQTGTKVYYQSANQIPVKHENKDILYRDSRCRYELFRQKSLRFNANDDDFIREKHMLCDISLFAGNENVYLKSFSIQGSMIIGDEEYCFAPAHSFAAIIHDSSYAYAALIKDSEHTVLLMHMDGDRVRMRIVNHTTDQICDCTLEKTAVGKHVTGVSEGYCVDLLLASPEQTGNRKHAKEPVYIVNGEISFNRLSSKPGSLSIRNCWFIRL